MVRHGRTLHLLCQPFNCLSHIHSFRCDFKGALVCKPRCILIAASPACLSKFDMKFNIPGVNRQTTFCRDVDGIPFDELVGSFLSCLMDFPPDFIENGGRRLLGQLFRLTNAYFDLSKQSPPVSIAWLMCDNGLQRFQTYGDLAL